MKAPIVALILAAAATPALADPLGEALDAAGGSLCFQQAGPPPAGQQWRAVRLSLTRNADGVPIMRLRLEGADRPLLIYSACAWTAEGINRGGGGRILDPTFLPASGVTCFMQTGSDEEAGSFPTDWGDGQTLQVHLPSTVAAWRSWDTKRKPAWPDVDPADRIIRVSRAPAEACADLNAKFGPVT